jgi:hypothetical protein
LDPESEPIPDTEPVPYQELVPESELVPEPELVPDPEPEPLFSSNDLRIWVLPEPVPDPEPVHDLNKCATLLKKTEKLKKTFFMRSIIIFLKTEFFSLGWHVTFPFLESLGLISRNFATIFTFILRNFAKYGHEISRNFAK